MIVVVRSSDGYRPLSSFDHIGYGDFLRGHGQRVPASISAMRDNQARLPQPVQDGFKKSRRYALSIRDLRDRDGYGRAVTGELEDGSQGIIALFRNPDGHKKYH